MHHILIAEEDPFLAELAALKLMSAGYTITVLKDGAAVVPFLATHDVHLVLLDLNLPNLDGLSILNEIRSTPTLERIPVLVFTNDDSEAVVDAVRAAHGQYFLKATTGTDELLAAVAASLV